MRAALAALVAVSLSTGAIAQQTVQRAPSAPVRVQLDTMPLGALATILMRDVMAVPYVISPEVLKDTRPVSVNLTIPRSELPVRVVEFLRSVGLTVALMGGTVYVSKDDWASRSSVPSGNPLIPPSAPWEASNNVARSQQFSESQSPIDATEPLSQEVIAVVEPAHRSVLDLAELLEGVLPSLTISARGGSEPRGGQIVDKLAPTSLVMSGSAETIDRAVELVRLLDKPRPTVEIRAVVFEVRTSSSSSSALSLLAELGGFSVASSPNAVPGEQFVRFASGGLRAILSATKGDGRFRVLAEPSLAALSGSTATINSGAQVPTIGGVSYGEDGTPIRSVVYRDSGVSLSVSPVVRGGEIELAVTQERSSFSETRTGVNDSPTLNRSTATARVAIAPGETIAIAGLDEQAESSNKSGFLGGLFSGKSRSNDSGQLLLLVQADVAPSTRNAEPVVHLLAPQSDDETAEIEEAAT